MELKSGYQQTEVGVIPEDWGIAKLCTIADLATGSTPPTQDKTNYGGEFLFVSPADLNNSKWILNTEKKLSKKGFSLARCFPRDSILFTCIGSTIGKTGMAACELTSNQQINAVFPNAKYSSEFLYYLLDLISPKIKILAGQQAVPIINKKEFGETLLPWPSNKAEQTAIANVLSDADALIQSLISLIAKKRQIKQGAMQTLLTGQKRLPEYVKCKSYKHTDVGNIPEDWDCVSMGEIGQSLIGLTYSPSNVKDYGTLVLRSSNIQKNQLAFESNVFVDMDLPSRVMVEPGDILICVRNGSRQLIGKCALIDARAKGAAFGAFMSVYRTKYSKFIFYQFQSNSIQKQIEEVMGATINQITNKDGS